METTIVLPTKKNLTYKKHRQVFPAPLIHHLQCGWVLNLRQKAETRWRWLAALLTHMKVLLLTQGSKVSLPASSWISFSISHLASLSKDGSDVATMLGAACFLPLCPLYVSCLSLLLHLNALISPPISLFKVQVFWCHNW